MFKKFAALSTAVFIVAAGLSTVAISAANASPTLASVTIKGETVTNLGTPTTVGNNLGMSPNFGSVTITQAEAQSSVASTFAAASPGTVHVGRVIQCPFTGSCPGNVNPGNFAMAASDSDLTAVISNGDYFLIDVCNWDSTYTFGGANGRCNSGTGDNYYYEIQVTVSSPSNNGSSGGSGSGGGAQTYTYTDSNLTSTSVTFDFIQLVQAVPSVSTFDVVVKQIINNTPVLLHIYQGIASATHSVNIVGLTPSSPYTIYPANLSGSTEIPYSAPALTVTTLADSSSSSSSSSSTPSAADLAAAAAHAAEVAEQKHEAAVATARTSLTQLFAALPVVTTPVTTSGTSTAAPSTGSIPASTAGSTPVTAPTLDQYAAADIHISSPAALARVNNDVAALPVAKRADITAIQSIVKTENFVDVISNATTQKTVTTVDLVNQGLIDPTNPNKASVVIGLTHLDPKTLNSVANIKAAIAAQLAIVQARKDRTAAILAKTQALIAKSPASK